MQMRLKVIACTDQVLIAHDEATKVQIKVHGVGKLAEKDDIVKVEITPEGSAKQGEMILAKQPEASDGPNEVPTPTPVPSSKRRKPD